MTGIMNWIIANKEYAIGTAVSVLLVVVSLYLRHRRKKREKELEQIADLERMQWLDARIANPEYEKREGKEHPSQPFDINFDPNAQPSPTAKRSGAGTAPSREVLITVDRDLSQCRYRMVIAGEIMVGSGEHNTIRVEDDLVAETSFCVGAVANGLYIMRKDETAEILVLRPLGSNTFAKTSLGTKRLRVESGDRVKTGNTTIILEYPS